jgi:uncharacterized protein YlzI (FlbEa/FlbD family)
MARSYEKLEFDGRKFDSTTELEFYKILQASKLKGKILDFECQPEYILQEGDWVNWRGDKQSAIKHYPDYLVTLVDGSKIIIDSKGGNVANHAVEAKLKKKIFEYLNQEMPYYYVSKAPMYLGGLWLETSPNNDMLKKLVGIYDKLYPKQNKRLKDKPMLLVNDWHKYMEFHVVAGLFFVYDKIYTKKELEKMEKERLK